MKLTIGKKVSEMSDFERREAECFFASHAIASAMRQWGIAWSKIDIETRKAYLMLAAVEYMCGHSWNPEAGIPRQEGVGWSAEDCWRVLEVCSHWSYGKYDQELERMAAKLKSGVKAYNLADD